ncbi:TetR/AcrR family transcriptional regulator [Nocardia sp. NPDC058058]|uniref:TetR/AcrR family transcriptional regulator n=1 Tax=Nocardia sp. NPDC058058 TaxID=3346317 RepID=UPI0036D8C65F
MAYVKAAERERQVVAAAVRVLGAVGVAGTTLRAVAAEADIALGTMQYVFPSKDSLLRAVVAAVTEDVAATLRVDIEPGLGVEHVLRRSVANFWSTLVENEIGLQIMQYELAMHSARTEGSRGLARLQYERYTSLVAEFCEKAALATGQRCAVDFDTLGRLSLAVLDGLIVQYVANPDAERARRDLDLAVDMVIRFADPRPVAGEFG